MKKFTIIFSILLFLSFNINMIPSMAAPQVLKEGFHTMNDLNLSPNTAHTMQNNSPNEYAFVLIFDSNQIVQELIQLKPQSEKYILPPIEPGYEIVIVGNGAVIIS